MSSLSPHIRKRLWLLLIISALMRLFAAAWLELSNDEVYYWTYALYPDWSHYDHPPMVGWVIQLFSLNLLLDSELFIRLASVVLMSISTYIIFCIGKLLRDELSGWYAALLYTASIYASVISGILILPDSPQNLFWLLSLWLMILLLETDEKSVMFRKRMLLLGLSIGLAMLSKYTSVFLWVGFGLFILFRKRKWLKQPSLYLSALLSLLVFSPVLYWNYKNSFISFSFHGDRVNIFEAGLKLSSFFQELGGQFIYHNPIIFVLVVITLIVIAKGVKFLRKDMQSLLLWISLPLIVTFLFFSLFRFTLPHWSGPAYSGLLLLTAARLSAVKKAENSTFTIPIAIKTALALILTVIILGSVHINYGLFTASSDEAYHRIGRHDVSTDMYGWRQLEKEFSIIRDKHITLGVMQPGDGIISENWFPLAHLDYYVARPLSIQAFGIGEAHRLHKYMLINQKRGGPQLHRNYWYITNSRDYKHPSEVYEGLFNEIIATDTIDIYRSNHVVKRFFVFQLHELQKLSEN